MVGTGNDEIVTEIKKYTPCGYCLEDDIVVKDACGSFFTDINGKKYLDFTSGIFTNSFGHCFEPLIKAELEQIKKCDNIHGRKSLAELEFYQKLAKFMPLTDYKFICYNDGGYAVDRGISDVINYFNKERISIVAFRGGFHGKTIGTKMTINETVQAGLFENHQVDFPNCYRCPWNKEKKTCNLCCVQKICDKLKEYKAKVLLFEVIQGAGIIVPPEGFWEKIANFCKENNIITFADEVLTGGGRTGYFLASFGKFGITPDIISITKGLANGRPLSVLCEREFITENKYGARVGERSSTFAAHPTNIAVSNKVLESIETYNIFESVQKLEVVLKEKLLLLKEKCEYIGDVRCAGLMAGIEFVCSKQDKTPNYNFAKKVFDCARFYGLEVIYSGHILRISPPLNITEKDLTDGIDILSNAINKCLNEEN